MAITKKKKGTCSEGKYSPEILGTSLWCGNLDKDGSLTSYPKTGAASWHLFSQGEKLIISSVIPHFKLGPHQIERVIEDPILIKIICAIIDDRDKQWQSAYDNAYPAD